MYAYGDDGSTFSQTFVSNTRLYSSPEVPPKRPFLHSGPLLRTCLVPYVTMPFWIRPLLEKISSLYPNIQVTSLNNSIYRLAFFRKKPSIYSTSTCTLLCPHSLLHWVPPIKWDAYDVYVTNVGMCFRLP